MEASGQGADAMQELREDAHTIGKAAKSRVLGEVDARKGPVIEQLSTIADALNTTADQLGDGPAWLKSAVQQGAQGLQRLADGLGQRDGQALAREVKQIARERPATFLGACAIAGFAAARVLKAGSDTADVEFTPDFTAEEGPNVSAASSDPYLQSSTASPSAFSSLAPEARAEEGWQP